MEQFKATPVQHLPIVWHSPEGPQGVIVSIHDKVRESSPPGTPGRLWHVRGIIDGQIVMRTWSYISKAWSYRTTGPWGFVCGLYRLDS